MTKLFSRREAADYLNIKPRTFSDWVKRGLAPPKIWGTRKWSQQAIDDHLNAHSGVNAKGQHETGFEQWLRPGRSG
jgi:hypothetical protein